MKRRSILDRWPVLRSPWIKYGVIALALGLWAYGLVDQFHSSSMTMAYLAISALVVAIARV